MKRAEWALNNKDTKFVRGFTKGIFKLSKVCASTNDDEVNVELLIHVDLKNDKLPKIVAKHYARGHHNLRLATFSQQYFQELRVLSDYDEKDGVVIGEVFSMNSKSTENGGTGVEKTLRSSKHQISFKVREHITKNRLGASCCLFLYMFSCWLSCSPLIF